MNILIATIIIVMVNTITMEMLILSTINIFSVTNMSATNIRRKIKIAFFVKMNGLSEVKNNPSQSRKYFGKSFWFVNPDFAHGQFQGVKPRSLSRS
ncbi:hypothetical protein [Candidatus Nitrosotalea okcheonensis]|uniref:hypothetical protein n=1 Tax=Candidatus Nitrosotalea okcheonensis TaxID=1903276 RepID=UPI0013901317|nr:hypothetical protein [Candidatus Nitrosotalea okcheonensis]